jgi:membrane protein insertase Oxa1/YidC/SpoIIIJ
MAVFLVQQKFMRPPTQGEISDQAAQQQKIMRFMTMLFPLFLYNAPAGLTLYILASTGSGILDSYLVRKHIKRQEEQGQGPGGPSGPDRSPTDPDKPKEGGFMDRMRQAAEAKRTQVEQQRRRLEGNQQQQRSRRRKK